MRKSIQFLGGLACLACLATVLAAATPAQASYFIRPYVQLGMGVVDGYQINAAKTGSAHFGNEVRAEVDLPNGTVRNYLEVTGPNATLGGFRQSLSVFGEQLTFYGSAGQTIDFNFGFDGTITAPAFDAPDNSTLMFSVSARLFVFEAGSGATYANFTSLGTELDSASFMREFRNPAEEIDTFLQDALSVSVTPTSGIDSYDVFAFLNLSAVVNNNSGTVVMDFMHTGTFGIDAAPGVTYSSASGDFLDSVPAPAVPEPATWAMMIGGFAMGGAALRRSRAVRPRLAMA